MNVASLELCKQLFELSGWTSPYVSMSGPTPLYDLGYLLRKLPKEQLIICASRDDLDAWYAGYYWFGWPEAPSEWEERVTANTPEDCAALLAIELFRSGVLK